MYHEMFKGMKREGNVQVAAEELEEIFVNG
jgi:hypothetical protein